MRGGIITEEDAALLRILAVKGREIVMVQMTGVSMTVTLGAGETWCAAATTASSSVTTTMTRTTAARGLIMFNKTHMFHINITFHHRRSLHMVFVVLLIYINKFFIVILQAKDVPAVTTVLGTAAALPSPAWRARATVTVTRTAGAASCVGTTTAGSSETTSIPRMTVAKFQPSSILQSWSRNLVFIYCSSRRQFLLI